MRAHIRYRTRQPNTRNRRKQISPSRVATERGEQNIQIKYLNKNSRTRNSLVAAYVIELNETMCKVSTHKLYNRWGAFDALRVLRDWATETEMATLAAVPWGAKVCFAGKVARRQACACWKGGWCCVELGTARCCAPSSGSRSRALGGKIELRCRRSTVVPSELSSALQRLLPEGLNN